MYLHGGGVIWKENYQNPKGVWIAATVWGNRYLAFYNIILFS